jgi:toxin-antitoxin system PIN domain toxin
VPSTAPTALLDVNLLVALAWPHHVLHEAAMTWFESGQVPRWATNPLTESGLLRLSMNPAVTGRTVHWAEELDLLDRMRAVTGHERWPVEADLLDHAVVHEAPLAGHRQVSDVVLLACAHRRGGRLATLDAALPDAAPPALRHLVEVVR